MIWRFSLFFTLFFSFSLLSAQNTYPIILIHGFLGWGRDEMAGYYYWGGKSDLQTDLRKAGYDVYTVSVGPISSNWDRAIETFYQIKGGQVDYGNNKAQKYNIIQRPIKKHYDGLYPLWNASNPVHIISHSQGGQTARLLELLLKEITPGEDSPLLSNEYAGWIKSITTISTPHNGATLVPIMLDVFPFFPNLAPWFGGIDNNSIDKLYNFDLEQWGLERGTGEHINEYFKRLSNSSVSQSKNLCTWDLSPKGSAEFNAKYSTDEDVYYFSFVTYASSKKKNSAFHKPDSEMSLHLWPTSLLIGQQNDAPDSLWYENDGIVNSESMTHPFGSKVIQFSGNPIPGVWQVMKKLNMDHQAVIGHGTSKKKRNKLLALYTNHCNLLYGVK